MTTLDCTTHGVRYLEKCKVVCIECAIWKQCTYDNNGTVEIGICLLRGKRTTERFGCSVGVVKDKGEE
jgi:hypothetical protein